MEIRRITEDDRTGDFINIEFSDYATDCDVELNFEEFCFAAEDDGKIAGVITGRAYYNEVHIGDLIVGKEYRRDGVGTKLVAAVEEAYKGKGYEKILYYPAGTNRKKTAKLFIQNRRHRSFSLHSLLHLVVCANGPSHFSRSQRYPLGNSVRSCQNISVRRTFYHRR